MDPYCLLSWGLRLFAFVCSCRQVVCVHVYSGHVKAAAVALRGSVSPRALTFIFGRKYDQMYIFTHPQCTLPPCFYAPVCVRVVFPKMDADFKPKFPSRRRASSSKMLLSGEYMYLQKSKFL